MWTVVIVTMLLFAVLGQVYLATRFYKFGFVKRLGREHKALSWLVAVALSALPWLFLIINIYAAVVAVVHLVLIWLICDLVSAIWRKSAHKKRVRYLSGAVAVIVTIVYLGVGWFCAHHVFKVEYEFTTQKSLPNGGIRVVEIADSHLGITLDGKGFAKQMERVNETKPDLVVICGDFVDDDSKKADMVAACDALGTLETTYGVYFIYGNHDDGYFNYRDFGSKELRENLARNNVILLEDENVLIDDSFYIIGRKDRSTPNRASAQELTKGLDATKYMIMLDHQPNDYANEAESGVDLVLSGHTHGGHIFPAGPIGLLIGANDRFYGRETRGGTDFLVTSGISGWGIPFKTGTISEFVVIDIAKR